MSSTHTVERDAASATVDPGVDFQAAVGVYVGAIATGLASLGMAVGDASGGAVLSTVPTVFTFGLLVGALAAWSRPGAATRLGARRWRAVLASLPGFAVVVAGGLLYATGAATGGRFALPIGVAALVTVFAGWGLAAIARDTYIESITDEPAVTWAWKRSGVDVTALGIGIALLLIGSSLLAATDAASVMLFFVAFGFILRGIAPVVPSGDSSRITSAAYAAFPFENSAFENAFNDIQAYEEGLVIEPYMKPSYRKRVPWSRVTDVRLTEDALVIERRWRPAIRCDRSVIDDPESVAATLRTYA